MTATFTVTPFVSGDALEIVLGEIAAANLAWHDRKRFAQQNEVVSQAFTVRQERRVLFCGGIVERHPQHASLWALYADDIGLHGWAFLLDRARQYISGLPHRRVDAAVELTRDKQGNPAPGAARAMRWAERCGLTYETQLAEASPDGSAMAIYRRIEE